MRYLILLLALATLAACGDPEYQRPIAPHRGPALRPLGNYSTPPSPPSTPPAESS